MVLEKIIGILEDYTDVDASTINEDTTFEDLGLDSLDTVELMMSVEDEFGVTIEVSGDFKTVGSVVKYIEENM